MQIDEEIINIIEDTLLMYEDSEFSSLMLKEDGNGINEAEIFSIPRFINDYDVNYFDDESEVYDLIESLEAELEDYDVEISHEEAYYADDYHIVWICW